MSWIASNAITTGVFIPLVFGFFWKRGNSKGALASMAVGLLFSLYNLMIFFGVDPPAFWEMQSALQVLVGTGISACVYVIVSLATKPEKEKADKFIERAGLLKK